MSESENGWSLSVDQGVGLSADELVSSLWAQHDRVISMWKSLSAEQWEHGSRNVDWTVHETARHAADAFEIIAAGVNGEDLPHDLDDFNPNTSPDIWMAKSQGDPPERTIERYASTASTFCGSVSDRIAGGDSGTLWTPYGDAHWTISVVHGFWDGWLHERDMAFPLGLEAASTSDEQRLVALYAMFMAMVPSQMMGAPFTASVGLTGPVSVTIAASHHDGTMTSAETGPSDGDLRGDLCAAVDSLSGRGAAVADVLPDAPELLGALASFMST